MVAPRSGSSICSAGELTPKLSCRRPPRATPPSAGEHAAVVRLRSAGSMGVGGRSRNRSSDRDDLLVLVEARAELVGVEAAEQRLARAAVGQAQHRLAEREVLIDLARDGGRIARASRLRDQARVGAAMRSGRPASQGEGARTSISTRPSPPGALDLGPRSGREVAVQDKSERSSQTRIVRVPGASGVIGRAGVSVPECSSVRARSERGGATARRRSALPHERRGIESVGDLDHPFGEIAGDAGSDPRRPRACTRRRAPPGGAASARRREHTTASVERGASGPQIAQLDDEPGRAGHPEASGQGSRHRRARRQHDVGHARCECDAARAWRPAGTHSIDSGRASGRTPGEPENWCASRAHAAPSRARAPADSRSSDRVELGCSQAPPRRSTTSTSQPCSGR